MSQTSRRGDPVVANRMRSAAATLSTRGIRCALLSLTFAAAVASGADPASPQSGHGEGASGQSAPIDYAHWAADPAVPGPDLPPQGRSLFDHLVTERAAGSTRFRIPFPFSALLERIQSGLSPSQGYNGGTRQVMIPMGRSLQRTAAAPDFFKYPRIVFAVTGEPAGAPHDAGMLLKDRLYIGYVEKTGVLEVVSYNEGAGRFEFQLVKNYRAGAEPIVYYANRAICISCHQNHAPIFSTATWGETSANGRVAELLRSERTDFAQSAIANIDFPDDIDKATVRANALVPLQAAWRRGCETTPAGSDSGQRCRAAALTAVLQYGLSGERDFDTASSTYRNDFVSTFAAVWRQTWPRGLGVAQPSLPDRNPFGSSASFYGGSTGEALTNWTTAANVPSALDPLNPRPSRETWRFAGALDAQRFIAGWTKFFASDDFRALDGYLARHGRSADAGRIAYHARCRGSRLKAASGPWLLECRGNAGTAYGADLAGSIDEAGNGRIEWLNFGAAGQLRDVPLEPGRSEGRDRAGVVRAAPKAGGLAARLADGRALESIEIRWGAGGPPGDTDRVADVAVDAVIVDDFRLARNAIQRLLTDQPALFDERPLARARLMRALFADDDWTRTAWCCDDGSDLPTPQLDSANASASALATPELKPFFQHCAMCHLSQERFPPNFLAGEAAQVQSNLRHCAPRMWARLSAWHTTPEKRLKSPMPPVMFLQGLGLSQSRWGQSDELQSLVRYVGDLAQRETGTSSLDAMLEAGYEALPGCLAEPAK